MHKDKGCGKVNLDNVDQVINLAGWVDSWRDHGSLLFLDLRDSTGTIQIVFDKSVNSDNHKLASSIRNEWVIQVEGIVKKRIEVKISKALIHNLTISIESNFFSTRIERWRRCSANNCCDSSAFNYSGGSRVCS